jgi:hypothetical protein
VNIFNGGDSLTLVLDTFYDHRNGVLFQTNPLGALREQAIADGQYVENWNTVWQVRSARFEGGWSTEMVIPFKSLRYRDSGPQIWGINFRRVIRWKNEFAGVTPIPASFGGSGLGQMQVAATLVGLTTPARSRNLELKPYAVSASTTDETAAVPFRNEFTRDVGVDLKYGLSRSLTADVTVNTDFAQIEEDLQQINLTRFNLLFPEKRDFFLDGQGIFAFGGRNLTGRGSGDTDDVPVMFFSRQIGLSDGQTIPVIAAGRVTGKAGPFDIAALNIQTGTRASSLAAATNFSAVRLRRDIFRRSNIGVIATARRPNAADGRASMRQSQSQRVLLAGEPAHRGRPCDRVVRRVLRWHASRGLLHRPGLACAAIRPRAQPVPRLGRSSVRPVLRPNPREPCHVHRDTEALRQQPGPVQRGRPRAVVERPAPVGISSGQRTVRGL